MGFAPGVTVYCSRAVSHLLEQDILRALSASNWQGIARWYARVMSVDKTRNAINEAAALLAGASLHIERLHGHGDAWLGVHGNSVEMRPVTIHLRRRPEELLAEKVDAIELMEDALENGVELVGSHLDQLAEVVDLTREWRDGKERASELVTYAAALYLAKEGNGLIRDDQEEWWDVGPARPTRVAW